jgi:hypothetical protein
VKDFRFDIEKAKAPGRERVVDSWVDGLMD